MFKKKIILTEEEKQAVRMLKRCAEVLDSDRTLGKVTREEYERLGQGIASTLDKIEEKHKRQNLRGLFG